jgi:hypothetical protein
MKIPAKYLLAFLPVIISGGGWLAATWAFDHFGCTGNLKYMQPCYAGPLNLLPFLGLGLFWCPLSLLMTVPWSFWLLLKARSGRARHAA